MNLRVWVAKLAAELFPANLFARKIVKRVLRDGSGVPMPSNKADLLIPHDYVSSALKVLWADADFWSLLKGNPTPESICDSAETTYALRLPPFDHSVWREMVGYETQRVVLFGLLSSRPGTFSGAAVSAHALSATDELRKRGIDDLILGYIVNERFDQRYRTIWRQLSENALTHLQQAAGRVAQDAKWFLEHPIRQKGDSILRKGKGRPLDVERATTLEMLVKVVRKYPAETDSRIAQLFSKEHPEAVSRRYEDTLRKMVGEAKRLAALREGASVIHYVDAESGVGRRPSRKKGRLGK